MLSAYILPHPPIARPEVGKGEEKKMEKTLAGFREVAERICMDEPDTIIVISPHSIVFGDAFYIAGGNGGYGSMIKFKAPEVQVSYNYDTDLAEEILKLADEKGLPTVYNTEVYKNGAAHIFDHGFVVPMSFVDEAYRKRGKEKPLVLRISPSFISDAASFSMGKVIERAAAHLGRRLCVLASGDLSHRVNENSPYGMTPEGAEFDRCVTEAMQDTSFEKFLNFEPQFVEAAAQCGLPGFILMAGALSYYRVSAELLSYEAPFGIGYGVCAYKCADECTLLARNTVEAYVRGNKRVGTSSEFIENYAARETGEELFPDFAADGFRSHADYSNYMKAPEWMKNMKAGCFVSIHKNGALRGCIGTISACYENIVKEIQYLAVQAATADPRFKPVSDFELDELDYKVDVLYEPEPASFEELNPYLYGVIVSSGGRRGLLLPNLEGVDTAGQQVAIALQKAGIGADEDYGLQRFRVERHYE
ncbi:MAG: AmmeMemoRadiSam system protein A [Clostridia bacterium]|nr:AmmeMemoRadiSam system protein A [Clostridia bacterium]